MDHEPIVERIIHRMVRKHIAGTTMDSALDAAKMLTGKGIEPSITFLSSNVVEKSKAKYITTTYSELVRRIARSGVKASVQISLQQLGSEFDEDTAIENLKVIADVGNKYGVFIWAETDGIGKGTMSAISKLKGVGPAIDVMDAEDYAKSGKFDTAKITFRNHNIDSKDDPLRKLDSLKRSFSTLVLSALPEKSVSEVLRSKHKSAIVVEFEFGESDRIIAKMAKKGAKVGVLVPFGKDWIKYAMNNAPEGYMRFVASKLLKEDGENGIET